jgi:hypothetical protein
LISGGFVLLFGGFYQTHNDVGARFNAVFADIQPRGGHHKRTGLIFISAAERTVMRALPVFVGVWHKNLLEIFYLGAFCKHLVNKTVGKSLISGQLFIIHNGETYNATGALVK